MDDSRRRFLTLTASTLASATVATRGAGQPLQVGPPASAGAVGAGSAIDALFDRGVVIDALSVDDEWNDAVFAAAKRSGLTAIHTSLNNRSLDAALRDLARWQALFDAHPGRLLKLLRAGDVVSAKRSARLAVLLGFQNATMLGSDVRNLDVLHALGTRCIQLTYNSRNLLGDGCTERTNAGLSDFGLSVVARMNELRMVVDLSHCGAQTAADAIELSSRPPAFTHTMSASIHDHVRAKSDVLLRAIAGKGGMVGIATLGYFIGPTAETSLDDYLRHVDHAVQVAGIDHVGLASDYAIRGIEATETRESWYVPRLTSFKPVYRVRWPPWIKELDPPERFRTIAHGLAKRGYKTADIEKVLGGNWVRYLAEVFGA